MKAHTDAGGGYSHSLFKLLSIIIQNDQNSNKQIIAEKHNEPFVQKSKEWLTKTEFPGIMSIIKITNTNKGF